MLCGIKKLQIFAVVFVNSINLYAKSKSKSTGIMACEQEETQTDSENDENQHIFKLSDDFEIKSILGQGVFGKVYSAFSIQDRKMVALKIIKKKEYSVEKLNVFRYEESIVSQLNHENVISFYMVNFSFKISNFLLNDSQKKRQN